MKSLQKNIISLIITSILIFLTGCDGENAILLFSNRAISFQEYQWLTEKDIYQVFDEGEKVHYIFVSKTPLDTEKLALKVFEGVLKPPFLKYDLTQTKTIYLTNKIYSSGNVLVHKKGHFVMAIYKEGAEKPLTMAEFQIR